MLPTNKNSETGIIDYAGRLVTNDNVRHAIAVGDVFRWAHHTPALAAAGVVYVLFDPSLNGTNTNPHIHKFKTSVQSTLSSVTVEFYEGVIASDNGTEITMFGFNRCDGCDPSLNPYAKLYHTPTVDDSGNEYAPREYIYAISTSPGQKTPVTGASGDEYSAWLNSAKKYMWIIRNTGGAETAVTLSARVVREPKYRAGGR
jgi:hypothetical protein